MNKQRYMKRIAILAALLIATHVAYAQMDVFGNRVPKSGSHVEKSVDRPDKPNKVDEQGLRQGEWARKYANGHYAYTATFVDGKPIGDLTRYDEHGNKTAVLHYDTPSDTCTAVLYGDNHKKEAEGTYVGKDRHGKWTLYDTEGKVVGIENYSNAMLDGEQKYFHSNGQVSQIVNYSKGYIHGKCVEYFSSGKLKQDANYVQGYLDGKFINYDEISGEVSSEGMYVNGKPSGKWRMYDGFAKEHYTVTYDTNGKAINQDEIDKRMQRQMEYYEKNRKHLQDPSDYQQDPERYRP